VKNVSVLTPSGQEAQNVAAAMKVALTIRRTEARLLSLFQEGRVFGTIHTCLGQEWSGIAVASALRTGDFLISNHRCHGHYLAFTDDVEGLIAEVMGKETGVCGGRGGSQHLCRGTFFSNGVQGGMAPVAAGMALAHRLRASGSIGAIFIGDGTLGEGAIYEALNIISKWDLPLLVVLENNGYAQSTAQSETLAGDIGQRARSFGIEAYRGDTWHWPELVELTGKLAANIRESRAPAFLQIDTYRLGPHSKGDDNRDQAEIRDHAERDPINVWLAAQDGARALVHEIDARIERAVAAAELAKVQAPMLYARPSSSLRWETAEFSEERMVKAVRGALEEALEDPRVILLGEDIRSPYGGAFKATQGLSDRWPDRVRNTPISEAALIGLGSGLALEGLRPIVEIMFGDFILLGADQFVNHAAKFQWMFNEQVSVPLIVRTPMGGGRGYGPTHSQSLEKHLLGVPGTQVLAIHPRLSPRTVYRNLLATIDRPTLVIENKVMYGQNVSSAAPQGFVVECSAGTFPTTRIRPSGLEPQVTLVAYGGMVSEAEHAMQALFSEHEVVAELIIPLSLYPLDVAPILDSVARTHAIVVIEEGQGFAGFGGELLATVLEAQLPPIRAKRVTASPHAIPTSRPLEQAALPSSPWIVRAVLEVLGV